MLLAKTEINISNRWVEVELYRTTNGAIEWIPVSEDKNIFNKGEYLEDGTTIDAYNQEISIYKYIQ